MDEGQRSWPQPQRYLLDAERLGADLPGLAGVVRQSGGGSASYQLDGTIGVDAGRFGQPTFGPLRLATGELRISGIR